MTLNADKTQEAAQDDENKDESQLEAIKNENRELIDLNLRLQEQLESTQKIVEELQEELRAKEEEWDTRNEEWELQERHLEERKKELDDTEQQYREFIEKELEKMSFLNE